MRDTEGSLHETVSDKNDNHISKVILPVDNDPQITAKLDETIPVLDQLDLGTRQD